ncbi:hypothetical protein V1525DRAFT_271011 [Lipomyces kononenkoae]|uniref:Uncharacterized protein n=1 Tax=Lipomyces kononenkoae TaxID=34357 RepID=A0ACC3SUV8_LIPKO
MRPSLVLAFASQVVAAGIQLPLVLPSASSPAVSSVGKPIVTSDALQADIDAKNLLERANHLYELAKLSNPDYSHPTRVIGSKGHVATIDYIYSTIASLGDYYTITNQTFNAVVGNVFEFRLELGGGGNVPKSASAMSLTPPTKNKGPVFGPLVLVDNDGCDQTDYASNVVGSIAFIRRGTCTFGQKSALAGKAGAVAAVIYNNGQGSLSGTLGEPSPDHVATFGLSREDSEPYIEELRAGKTVAAKAYIDSIVENIKTVNIVAQTNGGDAENCVMLGAHSDSVAEGPGINDDGSGSLTLLEVATQLTKYSVNNCVRFGWWAGEEEGLLGSDYYVAMLSTEENGKIRLFMDYDMLASPNYANQVYDATNEANPTGSQELRDLYIDFYQSNDQNYTLIPFDGRSDYDAFIKHGIPGGGIAAGAEGVKTKEEAEMFGGKAGEWFDPCYHQLCDTVDNLNLAAWELNSKLVAHSVATFARSFDGFPERCTVESESHGVASYWHGPKLVM